ncbi:MAG: DegT/DnrJ/EryC1/StrS family aminotransferase [Candidatus Melainabacteria bacterium]|nr:DegT/DnrJ/EryC1/StrS family aminotransferase [Candidatus Melainabacteria bacterium]
MRVPLLDLPAQYQQIQDQVEPVVLDVLRSGNYIMGEQVKLFELKAAEYLSVKHTISCANGSDALYISLLALDIKAGDEVITTPFTYIASSESIDQAGATPVFADIDLKTFNIDPKKLREKINSKTKAIIIVHLFGQCCPMNEILSIAQEYNLKIIEDTAQAFGATYSSLNNAGIGVPLHAPNNFNKAKAGTMGDIGTFSFYPTKNLSCAGDGGLICTNSDELAKRLRRIKAHGSERRYYHLELGVNSRLDEIQAAILNIKIDLIDKWNKQRMINAEIYFKELADLEAEGTIKLPEIADYSSHIFHQFSILVGSHLEDSSKLRDQLKEFLASHEIGSEIYYPVALHLQEVYKHFNYKPFDYPNARKASHSVLSIPVHPELNQEQILFVCKTIKDFFKQNKNVLEVDNLTKSLSH